MVYPFPHLEYALTQGEKVIFACKDQSIYNKMVGWLHLFNGHQLGQTPGAGEGQGSLVGCCLWGHTESDMAEVTQQQQQQLNYIDYEQSKWIKICSEILAYKTIHI